MAIASNIEIAKIGFGEIQIAKVSLGDTLIYSAGNTVTYHVDTDSTYTEEADADDTVLSPKTFTPSKTGWSFVGWRKDNTATGNVFSELVMGDEPIDLYAVFRQTVTVTYYNGNATKQTTSGYKYYNNGNTVDPTFTISAASVSGFSFRGWSTSNAGNGTIKYSALSSTAISASTTLYGLYQQTITLSYNANGGSGTTAAQSDTRYYSSAGTYINPSFKLSASSFTAPTGYSFSKWAQGSASSSTQYTAGTSVTLSASTTFYAVWTYVGSPFYVVQNSVSKQSVSLTKKDSGNVSSISPSAWSANGSASLTANYSDYNSQTWAEIQTSAINTKNNKTLSITLASLTDGGAAYYAVNGTWYWVPNGAVWLNDDYSTKKDLAPAGTTVTWDISKMSSVKISFQIARYAQSGNAGAVVKEMRLY